MPTLLAILAAVTLTFGGIGYHAHTEKVKTQLEHDKYAHVTALNRETGDAIFQDADGDYWTITLAQGEAKQLDTAADYILLIGQTSNNPNEDTLIAVFNTEIINQDPANVHASGSNQTITEGEVK